MFFELEEVVNKVFHLHKSAREAYQSFLQCYSQMKKPIFDVYELNLVAVAKYFFSFLTENEQFFETLLTG